MLTLIILINNIKLKMNHITYNYMNMNILIIYIKKKKSFL